MVFTFLLLYFSPVSAIEEPAYSVLYQQDDIELRRYEPYLVAEVAVSGSLEEAGNAGFRPLFDYISGANRSREEIAMTAPVSQRAEGQKIAMTAPVTQVADAGQWLVGFTMPSIYTMESVPTPTDPSIKLREEPARTVAAIRYSGRWSESSYREHLDTLMEWIDTHSVRVTGDPVWARYNAPFIPWFMRRNEILVPVDSATVAPAD